MKFQKSLLNHFFRISIFTLTIIFIHSCEESNEIEGIEGTIICNLTDLEISKSDKIATTDITGSVQWKGTYNENTVRLNYTKKLNNHGMSENLNFVFTKVGNCLQIDRGYEFFDGGTSDISAITQVYVLEVYIKEWEIDKKLTGRIVYRDHHDKLIKTSNFWVDFTVNDYRAENNNYSYFSDCFPAKLPIEIDLNNDGKIDYKVVYEEAHDIGNRPKFTSYTIKLVSTDESINQILSPKNSSIPYPVIFEPPFSSENTKSYDANKQNSLEVKNALDVFYEFEAPFESYNSFLQNNLTNKKEFENNKDDYYLVNMILDDNNHYGWIKIDFNALNCHIEILDTYFNINPNQHVNVN